MKAGGLIPACSGRGKGAVRIGQTVGIAQLCRAAGVTARASRIGWVRWPGRGLSPSRKTPLREVERIGAWIHSVVARLVGGPSTEWVEGLVA